MSHAGREGGPVDGGPAPQTALLEVRGIEKRYGNVRALNGVSFGIGHGEALGLLGDNGAGKSTLVKAICGVVQPDRGEFLWNGTPVKLASRQQSEALGIEPIYQDGALCDPMPIWRNSSSAASKRSREAFLGARP